MKEYPCLVTAAQMLDTTVDELPDELRQILVKAADLCEKLGGQLVSRQVVGLMVAMYIVTET